MLTLWRNKLRASQSPERIFDAVRAVITQTGVLRRRTRRALDSTLLDDAVATQDTVTQLVSMIRRAGGRRVWEWLGRRAGVAGCEPVANVVERCFARLAQFRGLITRCTKRVAYYRAQVVIATIPIWLR